jgi:hypothetical protein
MNSELELPPVEYEVIFMLGLRAWQRWHASAIPAVRAAAKEEYIAVLQMVRGTPAHRPFLDWMIRNRNVRP